MVLYGLTMMLVVEQTRGYYIAVFGAIAVLIMCYNKKTIKFFVSGLIILIAVSIALKGQLLSSFLDVLFSTAESGETGATGFVRIRGMTAFWNQFINNPLFGYGFQETGDFATTARGIFYFNDNGFLGIVGQIGIWAFIIYGFMVVRFGYIVRRLFKAKDYEHGTLLLGLYIYMLLTSISLICYWDTTCILCPVLWALFEVGYNESLPTYTELEG
jgi:O-antigen ligase